MPLGDVNAQQGLRTPGEAFGVGGAQGKGLWYYEARENLSEVER